jgi:hypothetical protein
MWRCLVLLLVVGGLGRSLHTDREALQREDLRSVGTWFEKKDPALTRLFVHDKVSIDGTYAVLVVSATADKQPPMQTWAGVFVVYGKTNQVYMVLDLRPAPPCCSAQISEASDRAIYVEWFGDYGFYGGTQKFVYDLGKRRIAARYIYARLAVNTATPMASGIGFSGQYAASSELGTEQARQPIALTRNREGQWQVDLRASAKPVETPQRPIPESILKALPLLPDGTQAPAKRVIAAGNGLWLYIPSAETSGYTPQRSGIYVVTERGGARFYPVPVPAEALHAELRGRTGRVAFTPGPGQMENYIGPHAFDGSKLWFANSFYDGEGISGVGAVGSFDVKTRRYETRHLPEIAPWSGSALLLDSGALWIGLMRQPEGSRYGAGVLRFDLQSETAQMIPVRGYVTSINKAGTEMYFGTDQGVYVLELATGELKHVRVEPDAGGPHTITVSRVSPR